MSTVTMHVSVACWSTSISILNSHCMNGLWYIAKEVPHGIRIKGILNWVLLHSMEEIRCLHWISKEEHWEVHSKHIIVAILGVEFKSKTSYVS